jgi:hypothetical protein
MRVADDVMGFMIGGVEVPISLRVLGAKDAGVLVRHPNNARKARGTIDKKIRQTSNQIISDTAKQPGRQTARGFD